MIIGTDTAKAHRILTQRLISSSLSASRYPLGWTMFGQPESTEEARKEAGRLKKRMKDKRREKKRKEDRRKRLQQATVLLVAAAREEEVKTLVDVASQTDRSQHSYEQRGRLIVELKSDMSRAVERFDNSKSIISDLRKMQNQKEEENKKLRSRVKKMQALLAHKTAQENQAAPTRVPKKRFRRLNRPISSVIERSQDASGKIWRC